MSVILQKIICSSIVLIMVDSIYLKMIYNIFNDMIKNIQGTRIFARTTAAIFCYAFLILGLNYFILIPEKSVLDASILGFIIYGVFETTNLFIFKKWEILPSLIDTFWGSILFGLTTYFTYTIVGFK